LPVLKQLQVVFGSADRKQQILPYLMLQVSACFADVAPCMQVPGVQQEGQPEDLMSEDGTWLQRFCGLDPCLHGSRVAGGSSRASADGGWALIES
jgi:hypothetical protein